MKTRWATIRFFLAAFLVLKGVAAFAGESSGRTVHVRAIEDIEWHSDHRCCAVGKRVHGVGLWGDARKAAHGALENWPGGAEMPQHRNGFDARMVLVSGTLLLTHPDGSKELRPGSYVFIPEGVSHKFSCAPGADCVIYVDRSGPADQIDFELHPKKR